MADSKPQEDINAVISRLNARLDKQQTEIESLRAEASEGQAIKAENDALKHQLLTSGPRRLTYEETMAKRDRILAFNRMDPPKGKYKWRFKFPIAGKFRKDKKTGEPEQVYQQWSPIWACDHKDKAQALASYGVYSGIIKRPEDVLAFPIGFEAEGTRQPEVITSEDTEQLGAPV